jgi:transposase
MSGKRYTEEFKVETVKQVLERGHSAATVAARLGINKHSLYDWVRRAQSHGAQPVEGNDSAELRRLRAELKRVTEERDILKKAAAYFANQSG